MRVASGDSLLDLFEAKHLSAAEELVDRDSIAHLSVLDLGQSPPKARVLLLEILHRRVPVGLIVVHDCLQVPLHHNTLTTHGSILLVATARIRPAPRPTGPPPRVRARTRSSPRRPSSPCSSSP